MNTVKTCQDRDCIKIAAGYPHPLCQTSEAIKLRDIHRAIGAYLTAPASDVFCNTDGIGVFQAILLLGCFEVAQRNSIRNAGCSGSLKTSPGRDGHPKA